MSARIGKYGVLGSLPAWGPIEAFRAHEVGAPRTAGDVRLERVLLRDDARSAEPIRSWTQVRHPAVVRVVDVFDADQHRVVVRAFHEGITLDRLLDHVRVEGTPLSLDAALHVAASVAAAVADVGVWSGTPSIARAHGLLTPEVVLVEKDGTVRVSGHAARLLLADAEDGTPQIRPGYAPPDPEGPPTEADAWALAALCFELFAGERPPLDASRARLEGRDVAATPELIGAVDATLSARGDDRLRAGQRLSFRLRRAQRPDTGRPQLKAILETLPLDDEVDEAILSARAALGKKRQGPPSVAAPPLPGLAKVVLPSAVTIHEVNTAAEPAVAAAPVAPVAPVDAIPPIVSIDDAAESSVEAREASLMAAVASSMEAASPEPSPPAPSVSATARPWAQQHAAHHAESEGEPALAPEPTPSPPRPAVTPIVARPIVSAVRDPERPDLEGARSPEVPAAILAVTDLEPRVVAAPPVDAVAPEPAPAAALSPAPGPAIAPAPSPAPSPAPAPAYEVVSLEARDEVTSDEPAVADPTLRLRRPSAPPPRSRVPLFLTLIVLAGLGGFALIKSGLLDTDEPTPKKGAATSKATASSAEPPASAAPPKKAPKPSAEPSAVPTPSASTPAPPPSASGAPSASSTAPAIASTAAAPTDLPTGHAWVTLKGAEGVVVVNGQKAGKSNARIPIVCGWPWIVIAEYDDKDRLVRLLSKSQQYTVKCGVENVLEAATK